MNIPALIADLADDGVVLWAEDRALRFRAPKGALTDERKALLREHKADLLAHLGAGLPGLAPDPGRRHEPFPLSDLQAAYLLGRGDAYGYGGVACHAYIELAYPDLDPDRVLAAFTALVERHDMLRAVVHPEGYQVVLDRVPELTIPVVDLRGSGADAVDAQVAAVRAELAQRVPVTDRWPLFAIRITRGDERSVLHLSLDLLIVDYASVQMLLAEFDSRYRDPGKSRDAPEVTFRDYLLARRALTDSPAYERDRAYWLARVGELPAAPELPSADWATTPPDGAVFRRRETLLTPAEWAALREHAAAARLTPSALILACYAETVGRWSRHPRFTLNIPTFQRLDLHEQVGELIGDFTAVELLAVDLTDPLPLAERAAELHARLLEDLSHPLFTGSEVLAEVSRRGGGGPVLMPVVFTSTLDAPPVTGAPPMGEVVHAVSQTPQVWLDCQVMPRGDSLALSWDVREGVLPDGAADAAFAAYVDLVRRVAADPGTLREPRPVRLPDAQTTARREYNDTAGPVPAGLLHTPVLAAAERTPDATAVWTGERELTFAELADFARRIADRLRSLEIAPAEPVAVVMDKGWEQVAAVLGVLLAGGAYLPVETSQPAARRAAICADAGVRVVLTQPWLADTAAPTRDTEAVVVDPTLPGWSGEPFPDRVAPDELAYVIYTSGSTGSPKGVMISHRAALNTVVDITERFEVTAADAVLGLAGLGFDLSVYDVFGVLAAGGRLVLPDAQRRGDPSHWADLVERAGVTLWNSVPGQLQMLDDYLAAEPRPLSTLRLAMLSGDWIPVTLPDRLRGRLPGLRLVSLGGATEGSIWSIWHPIGDVDPRRPSIPYGAPLRNQTFHVLDACLDDCPDWCVGELYIGGTGVAMGYLNDPERTGQRFITHPRTGDRLYRTGDLGRFADDGVIEFLGREDSQVKIRGYRIELAEVEAAVLGHPAVATGAVVVDTVNAGGKRLAAFVEPDRTTGPDPLDAEDAAAVVSSARASAIAAQSTVDGQALAEFTAAMDAVGALVMSRALAASGLADGARTGGEIADALRAAPVNRHIVNRWLNTLVAAKLLTHDADGRYRDLVVPTAHEWDAAWTTVERTRARAGWSGELVAVVRTCAARIGELLSGDLDLRALLFPGVAADAVEAAYRDNIAVEHLNRVIVDAVCEIADRHPGGTPLRVLEVGGGVAGTAAELVPALADRSVEYTFTDPAQFFISEARERFADFPWVRLRRFDPKTDPRAQGMAPHSFDVVVAANTLHNYPDASAVLGVIRELLAPGGWLVLLENTRDDNPALQVSMEFMEVRNGPYRDVRSDSGQSFLTTDQWTALLAESGGSVEVCLPDVGDPLHPAGQQVVLARLKTDRARVTAADLARHTATRLPEYMVPSHWQVLDALPLTANGKVDRAKLVSWLPSGNQESVDSELSDTPVDAMERQLAALWGELLDREAVGRHDDFFALGGDSLLVARLVGLLRERVPDVIALEWEVVLRHMLRKPTVAALAEYLREVTNAGGIGEDAPLSVKASPVVHLHGSGDDPTTVLVHAGTGTAMPYRSLVTEIRRRSAGGARVVALEIPDLGGYLDADPDGLIEVISADYVSALLDSGARRLHVVGYCLGGLIATEVARGLSEAGADVESLTVISSHSPRFRLDDEILSEYSFAVMMGIDPVALGFPADENRVAAAAAAVLDRSPGVLPAGGLAALDGELADVAACFQALAEQPAMTRITRMCEKIPASAGMYEPEHMLRLFRTFRQSVFAITRYQPEPYAGDITFLRHSGAYPFPGSKAAVTEHWEELVMGDLTILDVPGDHFSCLSAQHAPGVLGTLTELTGGAVVR